MEFDIKMLGIRLKIERERTGLSAEDFGEIGNVGKATQYNYENGLRKPDAEYFYNIGRYGCDVQFIITGDKGESNLNQGERKLLGLYLNAEPILQEACLKILK